ncbi:MAG: tryptophan--tRNA ligase [Candidatus Hydrothermales bacterium]
MKRILSGLRPTGKVHIGNYFGALKNWVKFQEEYKCFFEIADWHVLTTDINQIQDLRKNITETAKDWLSIGIDPQKSTIFVQSGVKEHAEFHLLLSMIVTVSRLERNPTLKEQIRDIGRSEELISYGHLGYPVLQTADILLYKPEKVPVGEDQLPHLELARELARRFNSLFGETFPIPEPILSESPRVPGIDKRKMSKSLDNAIFLSDSSEEIESKIKRAFTDPKKIKLGDKGHPEGCVVFAYHNLVNVEEVPEIKEGCESGKLGCVDCKKRCSIKMNLFLEPIRERRAQISENEVIEILLEGIKKAKEIAEKTMEEVREKMMLWK